MPPITRLTHIIRIAIRYRLDSFINRDQLPLALRCVFLLVPWFLLPKPKQPRGKRLRLALETLGPLFVKFGQLVSTRRDLIPTDVANELACLQDRVPPFSGQQAANIVEQSLGQTLDTLFATFDLQPMASASVAQVHAATLPNGEEIVVKVLRPNIEATIRQDIALLFVLAKWLEKNLIDGKRLRPIELVNDYQHTILDELDLQREGANTSQLKRNFATPTNANLLYVPKVYFDYTRHNVLVLERIHGIPIADKHSLDAHHINRKKLAERGVEIFFTQVFRDNFFHADMHPGNIFIAKNHPELPQYIAVDCAIIGSLSDSDRYYLARNLFAMFQRDYQLVAELHIECGWVPRNTSVADFESAIRSVCEPIFAKPLGEIAFGKTLVALFRTARRFDMEVQPSLVLLQKTLLTIEGLGRELYPQLDLWNTAQPFLERWLRNRYSPRTMYRCLKKQLPRWLEWLPQSVDVLQRLPAVDWQTVHERQNKHIERLERQLAKQRWKVSLAISIAVLVGGLTIYWHIWV